MINPLQILSKAFDELKKYKDTTFVIKCDGDLLEDPDLLKAFAEDVVMIKNAGINVIVVHDGSNIVNSMMEKVSFKGSSANLSTVDQASVEIVEMVLSGYVNKKIVSQINLAGGSAIGISGKDSHFMIARRSKIARYDTNLSDKVLNFGFLGELALMNPDILLLLEESDIIPVITPIAIGEDNRTYKIDSNDIAGAIAAVLSASKIVFITNSPGIEDDNGNIISNVDIAKVTKMVTEEVKETSLSGVLKAIFMSFEQNTEEAHIIDGKISHSLMMELFSDSQIGTRVK